MLDKKQLERYLSFCMNSEADFAEIYEELENSETITALNGKMENVNNILTKGIGVRLYKGLQSVYAYSNETEEEAVMPLLEELVDSFGKCDKGVSIRLEEVLYENRHPVKIDFEQVALEEKNELLKRANDAAFGTDERIVKVQAGLLNVKQKVQIANSNGRLIGDTRVRTRLTVEAFSQEGDNFQSGSDRPGAGKGLEFYEEMTPEEIGREAARVALVNLQAKDCPSGKMPVVIDKAFGGVIFHEACGHALEATSVSKNRSVFTGKLGQQIASTCVSAVDDGTIPNAWGSQNIDDEGNFQKRRVLIENGILKSYMIDTLNGRRMGMESTSSSRRQSYQYEPTSRMSNTFILPGDSEFEELFEGIEKGLYAKKMGGGSVNPQTGEFNFAVLEGYMIENGKVTYPVKGAALIGNGKDILWNIDKVGKDLARGQGMCGSLSGSIPTDVGQPAIRVTSITVGGTAHD
ncbi:MAG: TldD/PmbA family protein [Oscillospiraceae bacterium]|nr:TldD/PmbA family protein [Oscillospiraceae bacterium]